MSTIFWDDRSPSVVGASRVPILVWNLAPSSKAFVRFLGPWRGVWLHWVGSHSQPCGGERCFHCTNRLPRFWRGYAPALLWVGRWQPIVCPVNAEVAAVLRGHDLAGLIVELSREGRHRNSPVCCTVIDDAKAAKDPLPPPFDVEPILRRMWRLRQPAAEPVAADGPPPTLLPFVPSSELPPAAEGGGA